MLENIIDNDTYMRCDIFDYNDKYYIEIDLPGFKRENILLEFSRGYLNIFASKKDNKEIDEKNYIKRERTFGNYKREFYVGNVDYSKVNAKYKDGVLTIEISKSKSDNDKKTIEIK